MKNIEKPIRCQLELAFAEIMVIIRLIYNRINILS